MLTSLIFASEKNQKNLYSILITYAFLREQKDYLHDITDLIKC